VGPARVEVVKGSQSALYGGSAAGGVVVVTTRRAREPGFRQQVTLEAGSRETAGLTHALTQKGARHELAFTASHFGTAGFSAADARDGTPEADGHRATRLSLTGRFELSDTFTPGFAAFGQRTRSDYVEGFPLGDGSPDEVAREESLGARVLAEVRTGAVSHSFGLARYRIERRYTESNLFGPSGNSYTGARTALDDQGSAPPGARATLVWGADWTEEDYDQTGTFGALTAGTRTAGLWGQVLATPAEGLDASATLRLDDHSAFGTFATGRLAAAWQVSDTVTVKGAVSNGFRAPSPFELYSFYGDRGLSPEKGLSAEIGAELRLAGGARASATVFALDTSNRIACDFALNRYANVLGRTERRGLELAASVPLGDRATLALSCTRTDTETAAGARLPRVPRHEGTVTLDGRITDRLSGRIGLHGAADVVDGGAKLGDFTVVNLALRYRVTEGASAFLRVENLFDETCQRVRG
jgi:vitamin B12 transporter